jgi:DNA-directed RNA polymerase subunit M/transcription elongation factor TFIIS
MNKPKFYQMVLVPVDLDRVIETVYPEKPKGVISLAERLPNDCACPSCGHHNWMIRPVEVRELDGYKPFIECMNCGHQTHL